MDRQQAAFLGVAALVGLVGVALLFVAGGPAAPDAPSPTATSTGSPTPTPAATPTPGTEPTGGDWTTTRTETPTPTPTPTRRYSFDGEAVNRTHVARLSAVGNYAARSNLSIHRPDRVRHVNVSYAMDLPNDREYSVRVFTYRYDDGDDALFPVTTTYTEGDETWQRRQERTGERNATVENDTAPYDGDVEPVNTTLALDVGDIATSVIGRSNWTYVGNASRDGVELYRYEVADAAHLDAAVPGEVTAGEAVFVVGDDGIVRYVAYDLTAVDDGTEIRYVHEALYGRLGETSVPRPAWADETGGD